MLIVETPIFTKRVQLGLDEEQYRLLQSAIVASPEIGRVIPGGGGIRKLRWTGSGRGRVIYRWFPDQDKVLMLFVFLKNEMADLTRPQLKQLRDVAESELR